MNDPEVGSNVADLPRVDSRGCRQQARAALWDIRIVLRVILHLPCRGPGLVRHRVWWYALGINSAGLRTIDASVPQTQRTLLLLEDARYPAVVEDAHINTFVGYLLRNGLFVLEDLNVCL